MVCDSKGRAHRGVAVGVRTLIDAYSIGGPAEKSVLVQKSVVLTARRQFAAVSVAGEVCAGVYDAGVCAHLTQVLQLLAQACSDLRCRTLRGNPFQCNTLFKQVSFPCELHALQGCQAAESIMKQRTFAHPSSFPRCAYHMHVGTFPICMCLRAQPWPT